MAMKQHLRYCLEWKLLTLPKHVRHNFVWAACRENIHPFIQVLALIGQLRQQLSAQSHKSIMKPHLSTYHRPHDGNPEDADLHGVGVYIDKQTLCPVHSFLAWDKTFALTHIANENKAKSSGTSHFSKRYPFQQPSNPELGGWDGTFPNLEMCIGIGVRKTTENDCLLRQDGVFVWSDRTMAKLGGKNKEQRMRFLLQMIQFFYTLMMGDDAIINGVPFQQYLGPLN